jgi:hypothetical protein
MEGPFLKRPRLSLFAGQSPTVEMDGELDSRRTRNDFLLKSRFEHIFAKYSHDFTNIGDEIDNNTLEVVVDNGHLQSMASETDPGDPNSQKGQRFLRAMTEAIDTRNHRSDTDADQVMDSIEEIAENAAAADDHDDDDDDSHVEEVSMDSDEELFLPVRAERSPYSYTEEARGSNDTAPPLTQGSSENSLFDTQRRERSSSPDSLFEVQQDESATYDSTQSFSKYPLLSEGLDDEAILQHFGPEVGPKVVSVISRAKNEAFQAHIEPAWRVPDALVPVQQRQSSNTTASMTPPMNATSSSIPENVCSPEQGTSLWRVVRPRATQRQAHQARAKKRMRAESEDPLQEDFRSSDDCADKTRKQRDFTFDEDDEHVYEPEPERKPRKKRIYRQKGADEQIRLMRKGKCYYCNRQRTTRNAIFYHWQQVARAFLEGKLGDDDSHDREYICDYVANSENNTNFPPRILIPEFRTLVELHEGQDLTFEEIVDRRVVLTYLDADAICDLYYKFRTSSEEEELVPNTLPWRPEEIDLLKQMCRTSRRLMNNLASFLDGRGDREIGDKLAEMWLAKLAQTSTQTGPVVPLRQPQPGGSDGFEAFQHQIQRHSLPDPALDESAAGAEHGEGFHAQTVPDLFEDNISIKDEPDSDEELFGRRL